MSEIKKGLGSRIKQVRKSLRLNQRSFGEALGVGISAVSAYESGVSAPPPDSLAMIAEMGQVTIDYLITGKNNDLPIGIREAAVSSVSHREMQLELSREEFTLVSLFRQLPDEHQKEKLIELAYSVSLEKAG